MSLQINTFDDLLEIVNTHPDWRRKLVKALFPEIDLPKALQELVESNRLMRVQLGDIDARLARMEEWQSGVTEWQSGVTEWQSGVTEWQSGVTEWQTQTDGHLVRMEDRQKRMEGRQDTMDQRLDRIDLSIADLKGDNYENNFINRADAIFGLFIRRGHDGRQEIANQLDIAEDAGQSTNRDYEQVLATDLLWNGRIKRTADDISLVVEVSWFAEQHDLDRAMNRAEILRNIGLHALPVVAAKVWPDDLRQMALAQGVAIVDEYRADKESWEALLQPVG